MGASRSTYPHPAAVASALANEAATRRIRPPLRLTGPAGLSRGWELLAGDPDALYADEFGELWWGRPSSWGGIVSLVRPCWPEEARALAAAVAGKAALILNG